MKVIPNAYSQLDAKGRLAGAVPRVDAVRAGGLPMGGFVGAKLAMANYVPADRQQARLSRSDRWFEFSSDPLELSAADAGVAHAYRRAVQDEMLFECVGDKLPMLKLAQARLRALGELPASSRDATAAEWRKQFELDEQVAEVMAKLDLPAAPQPTVVNADVARKAREEAISRRKAAAAEAIATLAGPKAIPLATSASTESNATDANTPQRKKG